MVQEHVTNEQVPTELQSESLLSSFVSLYIKWTFPLFPYTNISFICFSVDSPTIINEENEQINARDQHLSKDTQDVLEENSRQGNCLPDFTSEASTSRDYHREVALPSGHNSRVRSSNLMHDAQEVEVIAFLIRTLNDFVSFSFYTEW